MGGGVGGGGARCGGGVVSGVVASGLLSAPAPLVLLLPVPLLGRTQHVLAVLVKGPTLLHLHSHKGGGKVEGEECGRVDHHGQIPDIHIDRRLIYTLTGSGERGLCVYAPFLR